MIDLSVSKEAHYTVAEIAKMWHISPNVVRRQFANEPGVVRFGREETRFKRANIHLRIPESVMLRVYHRMAVQ